VVVGVGDPSIRLPADDGDGPRRVNTSMGGSDVPVVAGVGDRSITLAAGIDAPVVAGGASAAAVHGIVGVAPAPRDNPDGDGDGEAIGDTSRDHTTLIGRMAYILPFSGAIAGPPIPV